LNTKAYQALIGPSVPANFITDVQAMNGNIYVRAPEDIHAAGGQPLYIREGQDALNGGNGFDLEIEGSASPCDLPEAFDCAYESHIVSLRVTLEAQRRQVQDAAYQVFLAEFNRLKNKYPTPAETANLLALYQKYLTAKDAADYATRSTSSRTKPAFPGPPTGFKVSSRRSTFRTLGSRARL